MAPVKTLLPAALIVLAMVVTACSTTAQRGAGENAAIQSEAAHEVRRICALPESQRQAEIQKIRVESGVVVTCGH
jgi:predicted small secreted protein